MDVGSIVAIAVPNLVTALALVLTWKQSNRRLEAGRELADLEAVRSILDQCAIDLRGLLGSMSLTTAPGFGDREFTDEETREGQEKFGRHGEALDEMENRLRIRFGSGHALVLTLERTLWAALEAKIASDDVQGGKSRPEEVYEKLKDALSRTMKNGHEFMETAQRVAGVQVPAVE